MLHSSHQTLNKPRVKKDIHHTGQGIHHTRHHGVINVLFCTQCDQCPVWWMSFFTHSVMKVWCLKFDECLVWSMSGVINVLFHTPCDQCLVWWTSHLINVGQSQIGFLRTFVPNLCRLTLLVWINTCARAGSYVMLRLSSNNSPTLIFAGTLVLKVHQSKGRLQKHESRKLSVKGVPPSPWWTARGGFFSEKDAFCPKNTVFQWIFLKKSLRKRVSKSQWKKKVNGKS